MFKRILVIAFSSVFFVSFVIVCSIKAQVYFKDDFSEDDSNWVSICGNWIVEDGIYRETSGDSNYITVIADSAWDEDWVEYTIEVKGRKVSGQEGFLILFRLYGTLKIRGKNFRDLPEGMADDDKNTQYCWFLGGQNNTRSCVERWIEDARVEQGNTGNFIETGEWYDIVVKNREDGYTLILNDKFIAEVDDEEVSGGRIGLGGWNTKVDYDNVLVYGPEGAVKALLPKAKLTTAWGRIKH